MEKGNFNQGFKNTFSRKKIRKFLDRHGFYLVLLLCLCIIGTTAILTSDGKWGLWRNLEDGEEISYEIPAEISPEGTDSIDISITDVLDGGEILDDDTAVSEDVIAVKEPMIEDNTASTTPAPETTIAVIKPASPAKDQNTSLKLMEWPVSGEIIKAYSMDALVYSRTLKEWTTHTGIDIASKLGSEVRAALDGVVEAVEEDMLMGIIIILDHGEGLKTAYAGLSTKDMVRVGQRIEKGQVISGIGRTAAIEIADAPHLHFEVMLNGEYVDPIEYLQR